MKSAPSVPQEALSRDPEAVGQSEATLRQVVDTIPALVWSNLPDGPNDFSNQRWHDYTDISSEEADSGFANVCQCSWQAPEPDRGRRPGETQRKDDCLPETAEQRFRGLEVVGGEPLGEAGVDRSQKVARRRGPSLVMP
jgi:PAS domain-containing protein